MKMSMDDVIVQASGAQAVCNVQLAAATVNSYQWLSMLSILSMLSPVGEQRVSRQ
jgi:hypothetical protein